MMTPRQLYLRLLHGEIDGDTLASARNFLSQADMPLFTNPSQESVLTVGAVCNRDRPSWQTPLSRLQTAPTGGAGLPDLDDPQQLAIALRWYAPSALLQWDWLRRIGHSAGGHRPANALLLRAYLDAVGLDDPALALAAQYRALLSAAGVHVPGRLVDDAGLDEDAFLAPCAALSLACFPAEGFGAILGYTQAHCRLGGDWLDWLQRQLQRHGLPTGYVQRHRQLLERHGARAQSAVEGEGQGMAAGWRLYEHLQQAGAAALRRELANPPAVQAERMLRGKLPYAVGHHGGIPLGGKSLDRWLEEGDLPRLRQALLQSRYVKAEDLDGSRLLKAMEFGGPMFGVFSEEDQRLLRRWLEEKAGASSDSPLIRGARGGKEAAAGSSAAAMHNADSHDSSAKALRGGVTPPGSLTPPAPLVRGGGRATVRELYHRLLNREVFPHSLPYAAHYAEKILDWTRLTALLQRGLRRHFAYSPIALKQRVDAIHRHEIGRYRPLQGAPKLPREIYLWGVEQMAPAILVDGCWLENAAGAEPAADDVRRRLLRTFADEAGAGRVEWNHPNVYRRLLESLDIHFPPIESREFAHDQRLADAAFAMPTYLLAVGLWPERFFPELLGLNLAIELNGLGATYMHLVDALRYHGIDPTIVHLHLSIDNLASGHAALAREAIELYLEQVGRLGGEAAVNPAWRRVWSGYLSLSIASLPFAWSGLRRYGRWKFDEKARPLCDALRPS